MQQDQRLAFTLFDVMEPEGSHFNELPYRRLFRSALFAMKRLTSADMTRATTTTAAPVATGCGAFVGDAKEVLESRWLKLLGGISSRSCVIECSLKPEDSEPCCTAIQQQATPRFVPK